VKYVAIIGEDELNKGIIQLKNMESGVQKELTELEMMAFFTK
jgi:histidyl-tRNA synthetase